MPKASGRPRRLTLATLFDSKVFDEKTVRQPHWMKDNRRLSYLDQWPGSELLTVWVYDIQTDSRQPLFDPETVRLEGMEKPLAVHACTWSPDEGSLLLTGEAPARFRSCGDLYLYSLAGCSLRRLTDTAEPQRHPAFSPGGDCIGFVRSDDLWTVALPGGEERRLTFDAGPAVYNGRFGWAYEEELGLGAGWSWSPNGDRIAFFQQDETAVPEVLLPDYDDLHATPRRTRYPKAGDPNPTARIGVLTPGTAEVRWLDLAPRSESGEVGEHYLARMQWTPDGRGLLVQRLPRLQNRLELLYVDATTGVVRALLTETDEAWVDLPGEVRFVGQSRRFLWLSDRDGYRHLYLHDVDGGDVRRLTGGAWEVESIAGVDADRGVVHFTAAVPSPTQRRLLSVDLGGGPVRTCCDDPGTHRALFSNDGRSLLHTHSALNRAPTIVARHLDRSVSQALAENGPPPLVAEDRAVWEMLTVRTSDGEVLNARMLKPPSLEPGRRYPVLMHTYGGPGSQVVLDTWGGKGALWYNLLARRGILVFLIDNRGTGGRGRDFRKQTYLRLGHWEVHDQVEGARYLAGLPFVDARRIGIWGWSYGGYLSALCLLKAPDVFRAAIAVAPVTDWSLYDTIYTERYLRRPADNPEGYREGSPVTHAASLKGRLLIVHGTSDDNVHFQNAARLVHALQEAGKPFETMFYPGKGHGIEGRHLHLYSAMTRFLRSNL